MNVADSLAIASSGLANINQGFAVIAQNIANAGDPAFVREVATQTSVTAGGQPMGVRTGATTRALDAAVQSAVTAQQSTASGLDTTTAALQQIDAVQGTVGAGTDLASLLGKLQDAFSTLETDPSNQAQQQAVVGAASTLTGQINALAGAVQTQQQTAQDGIVADVATANQTLATIGALSTQIIALKSSGASTADLENQRDTAVASLSKLMSVQAVSQANGDLQLITAGGLTLPTRFTTPPLAVADATIGAGAFYPGAGLPAVTLGGVDVTTQISGGSIGANITLRDTTLPTYRAGLDEFSETLAGRFANQGLGLFTDATGGIPGTPGPPVQAGYIGFSTTIQVNPLVTATPSLVRDGTGAVIGTGTGASSFSPNPAGGPAGFTTLIQRVLTYALGSEAQPGVPQPAANTSGLGPGGTLSVPFTPPATLAAFATDLVSSQAQDSAQASASQTTENAVLTSLQATNAQANGVSIDTEVATMIQLQNAYAANARVMSGVQTMWNALLQAVQ